MDALPQRIQIKRKRGDDPGPESLYLQPEAESETSGQQKRIRTENTYFFKRISSTPANESQLPVPSIPDAPSTTTNPPSQPAPTEQNGSAQQAFARRFHLTRPAPSNYATSPPPQSRKRRGETSIATFVERSSASKSEATASPAQHGEQQARPKTPPLKRPTVRAVPSQPSTPATAPKTKPPSEPPSDTVLIALQMMADEVANADTHAAPTPSHTVMPKSTKKIWKPIVPTKRFKDRNPAPENDAMEIDDPSDYITETYILHTVPADATTSIPHDAGVLIIPASEEELWESYLMNDAPSSDEEFDTDDEDSNAEDWHGADYPEDEDDEDGGYGRDDSDFERDDDDDDLAYGSDAEDEGLGAGWKRTYV